jgi:redox-sensing transcriptional repressor
MKTDRVSELTTNRLSVYLRCLNELAATGVETVSSQMLAEQFNLNSAQIRKDLAYFGEFGVRGVGYCVEELRRHLREILGLTSEHRVAIIGGGNLGMALADYPGFNSHAFQVVAIFDNDLQKIGAKSRNGIEIYRPDSMSQIIQREGVDIVIIAVPASAAEIVCEQAMAAGIRAVLNFAPVRLHTQPRVKVKNVDLTNSLESLSFFLARRDSDCGPEDGKDAGPDAGKDGGPDVGKDVGPDAGKDTGTTVDYRDFHHYADREGNGQLHRKP